MRRTVATRIEEALSRLGEDSEPPRGWEKRVLRGAHRTRRRRYLLALALVVIAAAIAVAIIRREPAYKPLTLDVTIEPGPGVWR